MSIKGFLDELNASFTNKEEEKRKASEAFRKEENERKEFYRQFTDVYSNAIVKQVKKAEKELRRDFKIKYKAAPSFSTKEIFEGNITFYPRFSSNVFEAKLLVQGQPKERNLQLSGNAVFKLHARHKGATLIYKDDIGKFDPAQVEGYLTEVLRYYFLEN